MSKSTLEPWKLLTVGDLVEKHFCGPSPDCEERQIFKSDEWGVLKTTAITWSGWDERAHKVLPKVYWNRPGIEVHAGDVLVTKAGPRHRVGVVCYVPSTRKQLVVSGKMIGLRPKAGAVDSAVLAGLIARQAPQKYIQDRTTGMAESQVNFANEVLLNTPLNLPPLGEQRVIAQISERLDTAIRETEAIIAKLKAVKQGLLHDLLTRGIAANGELRPSQLDAPHLYKDSPLGWIPKEWDLRPLQHVSDVVDPQPDHRTPREQEQGAPYIGIGDFDDAGEINIATCRKVIWSALEKQERRFSVRHGNIIYGKIGTIGQPKLLPEGRYALTANVLLIQPKDNSSFLFHVVDSRQFEKQILEVTNTTSQPALGIETVRLLLIPCPPVEEADVIASILDAAMNKLAYERRALKKLIFKKSGLMDDLLTGRVRVTPLLTEAAKKHGSA